MDIWDNLFEGTSLNTDPNSKPQNQTPKAVAVEPSAKTAPAPSAAPKQRQRKAAKPTAATSIPETPAEPAVDESIFFGSDDADEVGTAGATAQSQQSINEETEIVDEEDPFGFEEIDTSPTPGLAPTSMAVTLKSPPSEAKPKAGRPKGSKKKTVTAEEFTARMDAVDRGEPVADKQFPGVVQPNASPGTTPTAEAFPSEITSLVRTITRIILEEIAAFGRRP